MKTKKILPILLLFVVLIAFTQSIVAKELVVVNFYYSASCSSCDAYKPIIHQIEEDEKYIGKIEVIWKEVGSNSTNRKEWKDLGFYGYPSVAVYVKSENISNAIKIPKSFLNFINVTMAIEGYLAGNAVNQTYDEANIDIPFIGNVNTSSLSLPVLTIVLGVVDSFNVCSIFILFILLSLLVHAQSRKRMLLVGGIFVFFSGLWYLLFMFVLRMIFSVFQMGIISLIIGSIALILGVINIKDFFFFKKGVSIGIPEEKKSGIYKQMRNLVKTPSVSVAIFGTIALAVTVNLFELVCSFVFPAIFIHRLETSNLPALTQTFYILAYNVIYVIPLIIIVILFTFSLGKITLTEWQGQKLKLFSGVMISSFGFLFLFDYKSVENVITPILILLFSVLTTVILSHVWKKYAEKKEKIESLPNKKKRR